MCMGLASGYREPKEKLTVIRCEKCGRSWQVTEAEAKHYNEYYKGICADCRSGEEKKQCPFCGSKVWQYKDYQNITFFKCLFCGAIISFQGAEDEKEAIELFNRRISK